MAGSFSDYLENELLDHVFKVGAYTPATNLYVGLYTVAPTDAGGGTEVSGNNYARVNHDTWNTAASGATSNDGAVTFPQASGGNWGTVVAVGIFDAATNGNLLAWGDLTASKSVDDGDTAEFGDEEIDITLD